MTSRVTVTRHWLRIYTEHLTEHVPDDNNIVSKPVISKLFDLICTYFDDDADDEDEEEAMFMHEKLNELYVNIAVIGDDCSDKIGLICNYIDDYTDMTEEKKQNLVKENEQRILSWQKKVFLSSRSVNISIECLSEKQKHKLPDMFVHDQPVKAVIFAYDLCSMPSLQSVRKWYKQCCKHSDSSHHSFISILVGTNYERFKQSAANQRISVIEQSRKYARKMSAILVFIATANQQQINIKEIFLLILSKIYHFDSNIQAISNSKLPIIEFYDHIVARKHAKRQTENIHLHSNQFAPQQQHHSLHRPSRQRNNDHNRTKTSIEDIQNRLTAIRSNLNSKHRSYDSQSVNPGRVERLYDRFESQYASFMKTQQHNSNSNASPVSATSVHSAPMRPQPQPQPQPKKQPTAAAIDESASMYPTFLHSPKQQQAPPTKTKPEPSTQPQPQPQPQSLSELLENDALWKDEGPEQDEEEEEKNSRRKQQKHERALTLSQSLYRSNPVPAARRQHNKQPTFAHGTQSTHNRAMPSMPNFLSKLQSDTQLRSIITNRFNQSNPNAVQLRAHAIPVAHARPQPKAAAHPGHIHELQHKITSLESRLSSYQEIIRETNQTVKTLRKTIAKIESQRDDANKQIQALMKQQNKESEILQLKNKNVELQSLAEALSVNLARKEQSLEEALNAIHSLNQEQEEEMQQNGHAAPPMRLMQSNSRSKSYSSAEQQPQQEPEPEEESTGSNKGIMHKLRSLSSSLGKIDLKNL